MNVLLPLLILAIDPAAPTDGRYPAATEVFHCPFDESWDQNFDDWPDGWSRYRGPGFPQYVSVRISQQPSPPGKRCLRIDLDGGGAIAYSPPIPVAAVYDYVLEALLKTEGLQHDRAYVSITVWDKEWHRLETFSSEKTQGAEGWTKIRLGPVSPEQPGMRLATIGLHLEPGSQADLTGVALFDDVWLGRLPRISLSANTACHIFADPSQVRITCNASGFADENTAVTFCLDDVWGHTIAESQRRLNTRKLLASDELVALASRQWHDEVPQEPPGLIGSIDWSPPIPGPGFYRVWVALPSASHGNVLPGHSAADQSPPSMLGRGPQSLAHRRQLTLAVVQSQQAPASSEFGWALPRGQQPLGISELSRLIGRAGIRWVKYPLWYDQQTSDAQIEQLIQFSQGLTIQGIELVGLLSDPSSQATDRFGDSKSPFAAETFTASPKTWYPSLETVIRRMAGQVRWWQLGRDSDTSFVGYPNLATTISQVKAELDRIGRDVNLGFGWGWINQLPAASGGQPPWRFLSLSAEPPLTHRELSAYLSASKQGQLQRWVVLQPLSSRGYSLEVRTIDLIRRIISAKIHGAEGIFIPDPFDSEAGLMNEDGTPGELFLPWRTAALMLGGTKYLGDIQLPGGSQNRIFARDNHTVMVLWNDTPLEEVIHLGDDVRQVDLWGHSSAPAAEGHRQVIEVGPLPAFVTGIDLPITRWRQGLSLASSRMPSVFGRPQENMLRVKNPLDGGVVGELKLVTSEAWQLEPRQTSFRLAGGEQLQQPFQITLPLDAASGRHKIRFDFEIQAEKTIRFSVYRHIDVGLGGVYINLAAQLNAQGELEVHQRFVNETGQPVSFRCQLFAPNRRRLKTEVVGLDDGNDAKTYRLPEGSELLGKPLWLRAEEIDGPRVLNYRFVVKR